MQTVSSRFTQLTDGPMRPITFRVLMAFDKTYDAGIDFFTIGTSTIGGTDILKGASSVVQEWDKYAYDDYTDRILSIEWEREAEPPTSSITLATASIIMDNHDDLFTPSNTASPLYGKILPKRPIRINAGFGGETIPQFIGLTDGKPEINEKAKTAKFTAIDFLKYMMDQPLDSELMYIDMRTDEIIQALLEGGGMLTSQMDLDTGSVIIPFAYFAKGSKRGDALAEIAEAELGNVSMSEAGRAVFQNRQNWSDNTSSWTFNKQNTLERKAAAASEIINVVEVYSQARAVMAKQKLWEASSTIEIPKNSSIDIFTDFKDDYGALPVTTMDDPVYIASASTSLFATNEFEDGTGDALDSYVSLTSSDLFSTSAKLTFTNSNTTKSIFITQLEIFATPAKVQNDIYVRVQDDTSVGVRDGFEEQVKEIKNNYIQDATAATTIGRTIVEDRGQDDDQYDLLVKAVPQLEISDVVTWDEPDNTDDYFVTRISATINTSGFRQTVRTSKRTINQYFRIGISTIGGSDKIGP
jgi:hypothetical protein